MIFIVHQSKLLVSIVTVVKGTLFISCNYSRPVHFQSRTIVFLCLEFFRVEGFSTEVLTANRGRRGVEAVWMPHGIPSWPSHRALRTRASVARAWAHTWSFVVGVWRNGRGRWPWISLPSPSQGPAPLGWLLTPVRRGPP